MLTRFLPIMLTAAPLACSPESRDSLGLNALSEDELQQKEQLKTMIADEYTQTNANGEVTEIKSLSPSKGSDGSGKASEQDLRESYANSAKVFEFEPPEGVTVPIQEPG